MRPKSWCKLCLLELEELLFHAFRNNMSCCYNTILNRRKLLQKHQKQKLYSVKIEEEEEDMNIAKEHLLVTVVAVLVTPFVVAVFFFFFNE